MHTHTDDRLLDDRLLDDRRDEGQRLMGAAVALQEVYRLARLSAEMVTPWQPPQINPESAPIGLTQAGSQATVASGGGLSNVGGELSVVDYLLAPGVVETVRRLRAPGSELAHDELIDETAVCPDGSRRRAGLRRGAGSMSGSRVGWPPSAPQPRGDR